MIPSKNWFPTNLQERAAWYDNFNRQFALIATDLGFVATDTTAVADDNTMIQFLANTTTTIDAYSDAVRTFRRVLTQGDIGDVTPAFPDDLNFTVPPMVPTGMFERLDFLVRRIRVSPKYTEEAGAELGIIPKTPGVKPLDKPVILAEAQPGNFVQVTFVKGKSGGVQIETSIDKGPWTDAGRFIRSPANLTIPQNPQELPRSVGIRGRFLIGNNPTGDWSNIVTAQTIP